MKNFILDLLIKCLAVLGFAMVSSCSESDSNESPSRTKEKISVKDCSISDLKNRNKILPENWKVGIRGENSSIVLQFTTKKMSVQQSLGGQWFHLRKREITEGVIDIGFKLFPKLSPSFVDKIRDHNKIVEEDTEGRPPLGMHDGRLIDIPLFYDDCFSYVPIFSRYAPAPQEMDAVGEFLKKLSLDWKYYNSKSDERKVKALRESLFGF